MTNKTFQRFIIHDHFQKTLCVFLHANPHVQISYLHSTAAFLQDRLGDLLWPVICIWQAEKKNSKITKKQYKNKRNHFEINCGQKLDTQFVPKFERLKRTVLGSSGHLAGKRYAVWIRIERIMAVRMPTGAHISFTSSDKSCIP